ncbi:MULTISPECIES: lipase family protein [unclassified Bradyrhizobium]|uniref:lipase family protein n=1 Tax=unclassified Bradyrhizobium TaxID=2631580 RepID=UPI00211F2E00|nr:MULTISPECIES: hypothetical protein [unclassified Bradyrhizobium]MDD1537294.1 hypothetical protein [Bradyrhizobium sp. WBOS8]MDD1585775.1 hypothetical protein [Bradyrhizobium sp. WBOS4]UUO46565.1 hypothetical protein DCM78_06235 [Bradyrhizobium sp. WBOS04]UUO60270.1 hypothetical protein DCM80_14475 [Bradyrhizobium sp. WBOS08]
MRPKFRARLLSLCAIAALVLTAPVRSAVAQSDSGPELLVKASLVYNYAKYYTPYAIQAAAAYLPVTELDIRRASPDQDGYGADVTYAIQNVFADDKSKARGRQAFRSWQYQFGSDSYLTCHDPSDGECQAAYRARNWLRVSGGPAFHVWTRSRSPRGDGSPCTEVSIAFRGSTTAWSDWASNAHPLGGGLFDDYYHQLSRNIDGIIGSIKQLDCYKRARFKPQIVSTGHSLGAGLAQLAALANKPMGPRITKVFAFDPSPVTGADLVAREIRIANAQGLTIDRIYQQGEVLERPRRVVQEYPRSGSCNPLVRTVRIDAIPADGAVQLHGMPALATQLVRLSYNGDTQLAYAVPSSGGCLTRYRAPSEEEIIASAGRDRFAIGTVDQTSKVVSHRKGGANQLVKDVAVRKKLAVSTPGRLMAQVDRVSIFMPLTPLQ